MIVTFLGTGTSHGVPVIACQCDVCRSIDFRDKRTRSSVHFQIDDASIVVDTGPDFRQQMLNARIKNLHAALFTHEHKDHTAGLDDLRAFNYVQKENIPIYAEKRVINQLKNDFKYVIDSEYPGVPQIDFHVISNEPFSIRGIEIVPIRALHHQLPVFGYRIKDVSYLTDAKYVEPDEKEKMAGSRILIVNALRQEAHISHFNLEEALQLVREVQPEKAYLTHISHRLGLHQKVEETLPPNVFLGYDGLKIEV